jgi:hypothetical protein
VSVLLPQGWVFVRGGASGGPSRYCALKGAAFCAPPPSSPCAGCTDASGACHCDSGITAGCERKPGCVPDDPETCAGGGAPPPPSPPSPPRAGGVEVSLQVSALMANGSRVVSLSPGSHSFQMLEGEEELSVRVVVDRSIAGVLFELVCVQRTRVIGYGATNLSQLANNLQPARVQSSSSRADVQRSRAGTTPKRTRRVWS